MAQDTPKTGFLHRFLLWFLQSRRELLIVYALAIATFLLFVSGPIGLGEDMAVEAPLGSESGVRQLVSYGQSFNYWFSFIAFAVLFFIATEMWRQLRNFYHAAQVRGAYQLRAGGPTEKAYFDDLLYRTIKRTTPLFAFLLISGIIGNIGQWWIYSGQFLTGYESTDAILTAQKYRNFTEDWTLGHSLLGGEQPLWKVIAQVVFTFVNWVYYGFFWTFVLTIPIFMAVALLVLREATYVGSENEQMVEQVVYLPKDRKLEVVIQPLRRFVQLGLIFTLIAVTSFYTMAAYYSYQWECQRGVETAQAAPAHCENIQAFGRKTVADFAHVSGIERVLKQIDLGAVADVADEEEADLPSLLSTGQHRFSTIFPWFTALLVVLFLGVQFLAQDILAQMRAHALDELDEPEATSRMTQAVRDDVRDALNALEVNPLGKGRSIVFLLSSGAIAVAACVYYKVGIVFFGIAAAFAILQSLSWFRRVNLIG
jgi:hypothetical protein